MADTNKTATWGLKVQTETDAAKTANSVDGLRQSILASQEAVKNYGSSLRLLRGDSTETVAQRNKLKSAMNAERDSISQSALALGKLGQNYAKVTNAQKTGGSGPIDALRIKYKKWREELSTGNRQLEILQSVGTRAFSAIGSAASAMVSFTVAGFTAIGVAVAAFTVGIIGAGVALAKFALEESNALRTLALTRESIDGNATSARNAGHQIEVLADKVPQSRAELSGLFNDVRQAFDRTRISGEGINDVFNTIAQESAGAGQKAASALQGILERGKLVGRLNLNPFELQGTGITFADVAKNLSTQMGIGIDEAKQRLFLGRVELDKGAKAIRKTVEDRFAEINARKLLDLNVIATKFKDTLAKLTDGVRIEPILKAFKSLSNLFDESTATGKVMKVVLTDFANSLGDLFVKVVPYVRLGVSKILGYILDLRIQWELAKLKFDGLFGPELRVNIDEVKVGIDLIAGAITGVIKTIALILPGGGAASLVASGASIGEGLAEGIRSSGTSVSSAVGALGELVKATFSGSLKIQSPSKVFAKYGQYTGEGYVDGLNAQSSAVQAAVDGMAPSAPAMDAGGGGALGASANAVQGGGNKSVSVEINATFPNVKDGAGVAGALSSPSFRTQFLSMLEGENRARGVPTQIAPSGVT